MSNVNAKGGPGRPLGSSGTSAQPDKKRWKQELLIRLSLSQPNMSDKQLAAHVGITPQSLSQWRMTDEFTNLRNQIETGILAAADIELADDVQHQKLFLKRAVPVALSGLMELALQKSNPNVRKAACAEILDREGNFSKVSRIGLPTEDQGGVGDSLDNKVAAELAMALINARVKQTEPATIESDPASTKVQ